jgi:PhnB protein
MPSLLNPYIEFAGNARQAMEFYKTVFGGKLDMRTFKEYQMSQDPSQDNNIMHAMLVADNGITIMGADMMDPSGSSVRSNISVSLSGDNHAELKGYYDKLSAGGEVSQPLVEAPWGDTFGMCTDKFGIKWMVNIAAQKAQA